MATHRFWWGKGVTAVDSRKARRAANIGVDLYWLPLGAGDGTHLVALSGSDRGVTGEGSVWSARLGRSRLFRYEVRRWRDGCIPDLAEAVDSSQRLSTDEASAACLLRLVPEFPRMTWGRDEQGVGDMWNSTSLVSWVLVSSGHDTTGLCPPSHGRAPGWGAGVAAANRQHHATQPALATAPSRKR